MHKTNVHAGWGQFDRENASLSPPFKAGSFTCQAKKRLMRVEVKWVRLVVVWFRPCATHEPQFCIPQKTNVRLGKSPVHKMNRYCTK